MTESYSQWKRERDDDLCRERDRDRLAQATLALGPHDRPGVFLGEILEQRGDVVKVEAFYKKLPPGTCTTDVVSYEAARAKQAELGLTKADYDFKLPVTGDEKTEAE